jgi:hypothetical protein
MRRRERKRKRERGRKRGGESECILSAQWKSARNIYIIIHAKPC